METMELSDHMANTRFRWLALFINKKGLTW